MKVNEFLVKENPEVPEPTRLKVNEYGRILYIVYALQLVHNIESTVFEKASTKDEYIDMATLANRVKEIVHEFKKNRSRDQASNPALPRSMQSHPINTVIASPFLPSSLTDAATLDHI